MNSTKQADMITLIILARFCLPKSAGYKLPKDTTVLINILALHFSPTEWEEPDKFKPGKHKMKSLGMFHITSATLLHIQ